MRIWAPAPFCPGRQKVETGENALSITVKVTAPARTATSGFGPSRPEQLP